MGYNWIPFAAAAYLLGSVPFGKLIAKKVARIDITRAGSGNIGATNVAREIGLKWGLLTLTLDVLKGFLPVILLAHYTPQSIHGQEVALSFVGLSALVGHQFSLFERFRGGKGVATALGIYLAISPISCLLALLVFVLVVYKWDFVSLGSITSACAMPPILALFKTPKEFVITSLAFGALICIKHKDNIIRMLRGQETGWRDRHT